MAAIINIKNNGASDIFIKDLGITIFASQTRQLHDLFSIDRIASSEDLYQAVNNGDLIVNDGVQDLDSEDGVDHISLNTNKQTDDQINSAFGNILSTVSGECIFDNNGNIIIQGE